MDKHQTLDLDSEIGIHNKCVKLILSGLTIPTLMESGLCGSASDEGFLHPFSAVAD